MAAEGFKIDFSDVGGTFTLCPEGIHVFRCSGADLENSAKGYRIKWTFDLITDNPEYENIKVFNYSNFSNGKFFLKKLLLSFTSKDEKGQYLPIFESEDDLNSYRFDPRELKEDFVGLKIGAKIKHNTYMKGNEERVGANMVEYFPVEELLGGDLEEDEENEEKEKDDTGKDEAEEETAEEEEESDVEEKDFSFSDLKTGTVIKGVFIEDGEKDEWEAEVVKVIDEDNINCLDKELTDSSGNPQEFSCDFGSIVEIVSQPKKKRSRKKK